VFRPAFFFDTCLRAVRFLRTAFFAVDLLLLPAAFIDFRRFLVFFFLADISAVYHRCSSTGEIGAMHFHSGSGHFMG